MPDIACPLISSNLSRIPSFSSYASSTVFFSSFIISTSHHLVTTSVVVYSSNLSSSLFIGDFVHHLHPCSAITTTPSSPTALRKPTNNKALGDYNTFHWSSPRVSIF